jgi:4-hydroxybenzoate polyprenyltransferase
LAAAAVAAAAALLDCALRVFSEQVAYTTHDQKPKVLLLLFPFFFFFSFFYTWNKIKDQRVVDRREKRKA